LCRRCFEQQSRTATPPSIAIEALEHGGRGCAVCVSQPIVIIHSSKKCTHQDVRPRRSPGTDGRLRPMLAGTPAGLVSSMAPRGTANSRGEQVPSRWRKLLGDVVGQGNTVRARSAKGFPGPKPEESYNWMLGLQRVPISGVIRAHEEQFEWLEQPMQRPPAIDWQHRPLPNSPGTCGTIPERLGTTAAPWCPSCNQGAATSIGSWHHPWPG
jgi:hypothetical protein